MTDLQWTVRDIDPDEEIPEPGEWPEDEVGLEDETGLDDVPTDGGGGSDGTA